ncbi:hypothetical protein DMUE_1669 [Dictyocoela muelleri]|nr:hypothetical protein DMUE_1669 [Dictyocoela muelleri]
MIIEKILNIHCDNNHRKNIYNICKTENSLITKRLIRKALKCCKECCLTDKKYVKGSNFVKTKLPGERIGVDILEIKKNKYIVMGIDYFSRYSFGKIIKSKKVEEIIKFLNYIYSKLKFKSMTADNGREFNNNKVKKWADDKGIDIFFSILYYHKSNSIIEKLNRTVRNGLRKTTGSWSEKLKDVLEVYNTKVNHRGLRVTPEKALLDENRDIILNKIKKYETEFKNKKKLETFQIDQKVLIKNETRKNKMEKEFNRLGTIVSKEGKNAYLVRFKNDKILLRHSSQLRAWPGNVGCSTGLKSKSESEVSQECKGDVKETIKEKMICDW